jgi:hypothetical protein
MNKTEALDFLTSMYNDIVVGLDLSKIPVYFKEEYVQVTDGVKTNREEFANHLATLQEVVEKIAVSPFHDALFDEPQQTMTLRYTVDVTKKNGSHGQIELIAIFELADGRVLRCNEISCPLNHVEEFKEIARLSH